MKEILIAIGSKENAIEDIHTLSKRMADPPEIIVVAGKDIKDKVIEKASSLFIENNLVMTLMDPPQDVLVQLKDRIQSLSEKASLIIYYTSPQTYPQKVIPGTVVVLEKEKVKRIKDRVRYLLRQNEKVMTDKAFQIFKEKIKDESIVETELLKLINYVGSRAEIKSRDVLNLTTETQEENLITFFDALSRKDKREALSILENLLLNGLPPLAVHGYLVKQIRLLLQAKDTEGALGSLREYPQFLKIFSKWKEGLTMKPIENRQHLPYQKPYYAFNLSKTSRKFREKELLDFFKMLMLFDRHFKSGTKYDRVRLESGLLES